MTGWCRAVHQTTCSGTNAICAVLFYSILLYFILLYSFLFYSIIFYLFYSFSGTDAIRHTVKKTLMSNSETCRAHYVWEILMIMWDKFIRILNEILIIITIIADVCNAMCRFQILRFFFRQIGER